MQMLTLSISTWLLATSLLPRGHCDTPLAQKFPKLSPAKRLINRTISSTNPRISYHPECQLGYCSQNGCTDPYNPWTPVSYKSPNGIIEIFFKSNNWHNYPDTEEIRHMSFGFRGSAVYLYGAPVNQVLQSPGSHEVCLGSTCHPVYVQRLYQRSRIQRTDDVPVLLWAREGLDVSQYHEIRLRIRDPHTSERIVGITFHHLVVTEEAPEEQEPWVLGNDQEFHEITYHDTHPSLSYTPAKLHNWETGIASVDGLHNQTFHYITSDGNLPGSEEKQAVSWSFKGARLAVYGAPKKLLLHPPGHAEICIETRCHAIDMNRIYNNVASINERVLLYHNDRLDPTNTTSAMIRFLEQKSPIPGVVKGFYLSQIVVTEVRPSSALEPGENVSYTFFDPESEPEEDPPLLDVVAGLLLKGFVWFLTLGAWIVVAAGLIAEVLVVLWAVGYFLYFTWICIRTVLLCIGAVLFCIGAALFWVVRLLLRILGGCFSICGGGHQERQHLLPDSSSPSESRSGHASSSNASYTNPTAMYPGVLDRSCVVCLNAPSTVLIQDCGHLCLCPTCSQRLLQLGSKCPVCRGDVNRTTRVFIS